MQAQLQRKQKNRPSQRKGSLVHIRSAFLVVFSLFMLFRPPLSSNDVETWLKEGTQKKKKTIEDVNESLHISCPAYTFPKRTIEEVTFINRKWSKAFEEVKQGQLSFLEIDALEMHRDLIHTIESNQVPGMVLECGVGKGGSSILLSIAKHPDRCLHLFDTFQGLPPPTKEDGPDVHNRYKEIKEGKAGKDYYGYMKDLDNYVKGKIEDLGNNKNVYLHKGLFDDTVWPVGPVAFAHLDGDWYESTFGMLERIHPVLSIGGYFVLDDVQEWSGARDAFRDFFDVDVNSWMTQSAPFRKDMNRPKCLVEHKGIFYSLELRERVVVTKLDPTVQSELKPCIKKDEGERSGGGDESDQSD